MDLERLLLLRLASSRTLWRLLRMKARQGRPLLSLVCFFLFTLFAFVCRQMQMISTMQSFFPVSGKQGCTVFPVPPAHCGLFSLSLSCASLFLFLPCIRLQYSQSLQTIGLLTNTGIHVLMYYYFFMHRWGAENRTKKTEHSNRTQKTESNAENAQKTEHSLQGAGFVLM